MTGEPADCGPQSGETHQFERELSENSMEYMIFILDDAVGGIKYLSRLESISKEATRLMDSVAKNYIWQRDEFRLSVVNEQGSIHLHGTTDYGDAVEDEWLIVYVLRELSKAHPDIFIRVVDEDGEFLLVEAANVLPNWLNPEIDHCRVWLQGGKLKIIPLQSDKTKPTAAKSLTLADAIKYLRTEPENLMHSPSIEDEAFYRLEKYPKHVDASIHHRACSYSRRCKNRTIRGLAILLQDLKEDGNEELPTNADIETWLDVKRNDDESWLDINYEDFERELEGKTTRSDGKNTRSSGFGDTRTQEDLRKIVSRFEAFMNNETAGLDGADMDEMDMDNEDEDDGTDENSDMEDKEVSFDEQTFSRMMKEMMGLPADHPTLASTGHYEGKAAEQNTDAQGTSEEEDDIKNMSLQMEAELKSHGALRLAGSKSQQEIREYEDEDSDGEVDIDYNLAKNLLESFKSQGGMAGPTGNLLGLMGIQLPRDEDDGETKE
ncbi:hypothetical protein LMH87_005813 [Akanthomyces muscarius]|uniref:Regulatory factor Sgt1 n=1 Tax=Akanthomyces muscarius TaxID=2231603 RepID=A0A9W8QMJ7_AKAMU|nr:hypothetical protein LMH87_005813 [Akanthomyces muscarius]KAJ4164128.1 hypothetical protein LMH87_005813 [Akanthomyces muscarius]